MRSRRFFRAAFAGLWLGLSPLTQAASNPYLGSWELTIPGGGAGWLGIESTNGALAGTILWGGGSVLPLEGVRISGDNLVLTRIRQDKTNREIETITASLDGDRLRLTTVKNMNGGKEYGRAEFTGRRQPPLPPRPNLNAVKFGDPIDLFNGKNLAGWHLVEANAVNGWSVRDGILANDPIQQKGKPHINYGNLRTDREFEDFNLTLETRCAPGSNSGVYLRGIYEVQIFDSYGKPPDSHNMGAIYSRIRPRIAAEKPPGQWQTLDIIFLDRHVTVILNGEKIIDNQPIAGCTGGALWSDVSRPGPIYLQGDHSSIEYRNLVLRPVLRFP